MAACARLKKVHVHVYERQRGGDFKRISCFDYEVRRRACSLCRAGRAVALLSRCLVFFFHALICCWRFLFDHPAFRCVFPSRILIVLAKGARRTVHVLYCGGVSARRVACCLQRRVVSPDGESAVVVPRLKFLLPLPAFATIRQTHTHARIHTCAPRARTFRFSRVDTLRCPRTKQLAHMTDRIQKTGFYLLVASREMARSARRCHMGGSDPPQPWWGTMVTQRLQVGS